MSPFDPLKLRTLPLRLLDYLSLEAGRSKVPGCSHPCLIFKPRRKSRNGYGRVWCETEKRERQTHIVVWEHVSGRKVPEGHHLDHLCRVRECCAPWHLEPVTPRENTRRGDAVLFRKPDHYRGQHG